LSNQSKTSAVGNSSPGTPSATTTSRVQIVATATPPVFRRIVIGAVYDLRMKKLTVALAVFAAVLSVADYLVWRSGTAEVVSLAAESGLFERHPELAASTAREPVPARAAAAAAWQLLDLEIDRGWLTELPLDERQTEARRSSERLRLATLLAERALAQQPASWRAATVLGAARYLLSARQGRQEQPVTTWRVPLEAAIRLAPGYPEPPALSASFHLSRWSTLSREDRSRVPALLATAFRDPQSFERLLPSWVRLAPSQEQLLEPIPDRPDAWRQLGNEFLRLGDRERYGVAHRRRILSWPAELASRVERGLARLHGGHQRSGIGLLRSVFSAPPDLAYTESALSALEALPASAVTSKTRADLATWLMWAADLCAIGRCPMEEAAMRRLRELAAHAEISEPVRANSASASGTWSSLGWRQRGGAHHLALEVDHAADGLRLSVNGVPPDGAAIELRWDGRFLGVSVLRTGEPLVWPMTITAGKHLLQFRQLGGRPRRPGELSLQRS
jgi:hypothetical protein